MPTIPPSSLPDEPHQARELAESFGIDPARYDRARPDYPQELVERIVAASPGPDMLDVGCGTGIAARQFQAAGLRVLGLDIDARMAKFAQRRGLDVEVAKFEDWDAGGRTFDTVIAAQTWHWIDPVAGALKAAEVLRPHGLLALFRNDVQLPPELTTAFGQVYRRVLPDLPVNPYRQDGQRPPGRHRLAMQAIHGLRQAGGFGEPEQRTFGWQRTYTVAEWLDELPTAGLLTRLPQDRLDELLDGVAMSLDALVSGAFAVGYTTSAIIAPRTRQRDTASSAA
jgi:SAM-dependent methyltransferase